MKPQESEPKEMVGGCCVCSDENGWTENPLVYCDGQGCNVAVHQGKCPRAGGRGWEFSGRGGREGGVLSPILGVGGREEGPGPGWTASAFLVESRGKKRGEEVLVEFQC